MLVFYYILSILIIIKEYNRKTKNKKKQTQKIQFKNIFFKIYVIVTLI